MILAAMNTGNRMVSLSCEIGEFDVPREAFDEMEYPTAMEIVNGVIGNNTRAFFEFMLFVSPFDKEMQRDIVRVFALSV